MIYTFVILAFSCLSCHRPSSFGLGVSDEQTDQVELIRPPSAADFEGFPDAPTLHRLRQVSDLHVTDDTDPDRIPTNTGRSAANLYVAQPYCNKTTKQCSWPLAGLLVSNIARLSALTMSKCAMLHAGPLTLRGACSLGRQFCGLKGCLANPSTFSRASAGSLLSLYKGALKDQWS